jgi:predicted transposase/invertase (TIGR01784 family)
MGEQGNEIQLKAFLEAVLGRDLESVEIDGAMELTPDIIGNKLSRLDVLAKTDDGAQVNIEVQLRDHKNMGKRTLFYWGRTFGNALKSGKDSDYIKLPDVITINILGFEYLDDEPDEFHNVYHVHNDRSKKILDNCLEIHFIEMPKYLRMKDKDTANNKMHRWLSFFDSDISEEKIKELVAMDAAIQQAQKKIEYITNDAETYRQVLLREQALLDYQSDLNASKREGEQIGIRKGEQIGMRKGEQIGMRKGEQKREQKMINAMRASGMSKEAIDKILELSNQ